MNKVIIEKAFVGGVEFSGDKAQTLYLLRKGKLKEIEKQLDFLAEVEFFRNEEMEEAKRKERQGWEELSEGAKQYWYDLNYQTGVAPAYTNYFDDELEGYEKHKKELDSFNEKFKEEIGVSPVIRLAEADADKEVLFDLYLKIIKGDVDLYEWSIRKLLHL